MFSGKSFLFNSIVDEISEQIPDSQTVYFYCKYNDPSRSTFNAIVRCLIAQILDMNPACLQYLYDKMISIVHRRADELFAEIFEALALDHEQLFIGIDGLDECQEPERQLALSMIQSVLQASKAKRNVRVFLTSRKENDIATSLRSASWLNIRPHHLEKDIWEYVRARVLHLGNQFSIPTESQQIIVADIAKRSRG